MEVLSSVPQGLGAAPTFLPTEPSSPVLSSLGSTRGRKRRKSSDPRQFLCDRVGCNKSYSRAEHLQRHQLNHDPKELYFCDALGCDHVFVRKDLCLRHKLRHERQGLMPTQIPAIRLDDVLETEKPAQDRHRDSPSGEDMDLADEPEYLVSTLASNTSQKEEHGRQLQERRLLAHNGLEASPGIFKPAVDVSSWSINLDSTPPSTFPSTQTHSGAFIDQSTTDCSISLSPSSSDEFTSWLFDDLGAGAFSGLAPQYRSPLANHIVDPSASSFGQLWPDQMDVDFGNSYLAPIPPAMLTGGQQCATRGGIFGSLPTVQTSLQLSEAKRQEILAIILTPPSLQDAQYSQRLRQDFLTGAAESDSHVLSLRSLQGYIDNYWQTFDIQLPIIHRPTFVPDDAPSLQLLAILVVGASLSKSKDEAIRSSIYGLTQHVSWNLRWQVFMHPDSQPPAQLWVIQSLLLLEVHDKLRASRALHERAHVYFPTTLTLMRRGSTLSGRHSPPISTVPLISVEGIGSALGTEETVAEFGPSDGQALNSLSSSPPTGTWWSSWVAQESTRRAALTAFIIDSSHAVMFGHTPTLAIHELNLSLPCEMNLWKSQSPSEIACVESSLFANGINVVSFLDGLKKTFSAERVYTTPFGRVALVSGLLSIGWQMQQRELDRRSLGSDGFAGPHERWRPKLLRALDWWRRDFQESLERTRNAAFDWKRPGVSAAAGYGVHGGHEDDIFLTWGTLLYHLGHITQHVSMRELCVFAGARRILGRAVTAGDVSASLVKMGQWSTSLRAINAVYHALQIIKMVLGTEPARGSPERTDATAEDTKTRKEPSEKVQFSTNYQAVEDNLLPRPWALYFASLVVWAYGYSVDGPIEQFQPHLQYPASAGGHPGGCPATGSSEPQTRAGEVDIPIQRHADLDSYLAAMLPPNVDSVQAFHVQQQSPEMIGRRNRVVGLLSIVDDALGGTNWELLTEARERFTHAALLLQKARD